MRRRQLLFGAVTTATGAGILTGAEGFAKSASHRTARVAVEDDGDAYLGLGFLGSVTLTGDCEKTVDILTITNQSKLVLTDLTVSITLAASGFTITDVGVPDTLEIGETKPVTVTIESGGQERTTGTVSVELDADGDDPHTTFNEEGRFEIHRSWNVDLEAECAVEAPSFIALCGSPGAVTRDDLTITDDNGVWTGVHWAQDVAPETVVLYSGTGTTGFTEGDQSYLNYDIDEGQTSVERGEHDQEAGQSPSGETQRPSAEETGQTPSCPCQNDTNVPGYNSGIKFETDDDGSLSPPEDVC